MDGINIEELEKMNFKSLEDRLLKTDIVDALFSFKLD